MRTIISICLLWICHLTLLGQSRIGTDDNYNPSNPGNPQEPILKYDLQTKVYPEGSGSTNYSNVQRYKAGERVRLNAYNNTGFKFVKWTHADTLVSESSSFYYTMPATDVVLTAVFEYNPENPPQPDSLGLSHTITVTASPKDGGSFNVKSSTRIKENEYLNLYAYPNTGFTFVGWDMGDTIVPTSPYRLTMGKKDINVVARFEYNPQNPSNPGSNYWNPTTGEVIVDNFTPGQLSSALNNAIDGGDRSAVKKITVAGKINSYDFGLVNNYTNCMLLDLSRVTGVNEVPSYAFDYTNLESVYLPATIERIGYRAFADCPNLSMLTCYAMTPPVLGNAVFSNIPDGLIVYVPAVVIEQYQEAEGWKDFTCLPIQEDIRSLTVNLPTDINVADYKQMWLELLNTKSGQKLHYVMTDRMSYTFPNLIRNTTWNVTVRNEKGDVFGHLENIELKDEDVTVSLTDLLQPQTVQLCVLKPSGTDVTSNVQITWTDAHGNYLGQDALLTGLLEGTKLHYEVSLPEDLAFSYSSVDSAYTVKASDNVIQCALQNLPLVFIEGKVFDMATGTALKDAVVSVSQTFAGKYSKTQNTTTDTKGRYTMAVANVPTVLTVSSSNYISQTMACDSLLQKKDSVSLEDIKLKAISGAVLSVEFTYSTSVAEGETPEVNDWYADYNNVQYTIHNQTKNKAISLFNVQYPQIVLLEEVDENDVLVVEASSLNGAFMPVSDTTTVSEQKANITFDIQELGKIKATFKTTKNASVVGILYDQQGKLIKSYTYSNAVLNISNLKDGHYILVSMGGSQMLNTIYDLSQYEASGLIEDADYVMLPVEVKHGVITQVAFESIPTLDESKFFYTGAGTSFTVNKPSIVAGNFLTLTGKVDFKSEYIGQVSNVHMIVDLPEACEFVENSVMVGNNTNTYLLSDNRITIPMARYTDRVRFCVIPTKGGDYAPSAFIQFDLNGKTVTQPIGSALYTAKDLSITVPTSVAKPTISVSGMANGQAKVEIFDNGVKIGETTALANGVWSTKCDLNNPYNLSTHSIQAKVTNKQGMELQSESRECKYDKNLVQPKTVTMTFYNGWLRKNVDVVFDFQTGTTSASSYMFYTKTDITFIADLTNNDTTLVNSVVLNVYTDKNEVRKLNLSYDAKSDRWVGTSEFSADNLPINISISIKDNSPVMIDRGNFTLYSERIEEEREETIEILNEIDSLNQQADSLALLLDAEDSLRTKVIQELSAAFENEASDAVIDSLYALLGFNYADMDIPVGEDDAFLEELLAHGDSLLAENVEDYDSIAIDDLLKETEVILNDTTGIDVIGSLNMALQDTLVMQAEDGSDLIIYRTELQNLSPKFVENADSTVLDMTEGNPVLILINEHEGYTVVVDSTLNVATVVLSKAIANYSKRILSRANSDDDGFISAMNEAKSSILELKNKIIAVASEWISKQKENIDNLKKNLENLESKQIDVLAESAGTKMEIDDIEQQLRTLKAKQKNGKLGSRLKEQIKQLEHKRAKLLDKYDKLQSESKRLSKQIGKIKPKLTALGHGLAKLYELYQIVNGFIKTVNNIGKALADRSKWMALINKIEPCKGDEKNAALLKQNCKSDWTNIAWKKGYYPSVGITGVVTAINGVLFVRKDIKFIAGFVIGIITDFFDNTADAMFRNAQSASLRWYPKRQTEYKNLKCKGKPEEEEDPDDPDDPDNPDNPDDPNDGDDDNDGDGDGGGGETEGPQFDPSIEPIHDPSGYVYEAVSSNRLEGVMASCYYKETVEDMYGDLHENVVLWNAEDYAQKNPLFTDENGMYRWDVPQGLWQVKYEKEGYETAYSAWLPVPPPQLEVNIGMKQNIQPNVVYARAFENAIEVHFDKYMLPELLTTENIIVLSDSNVVEGTVELLNEEISYTGYTDKYASKIRFNATQPFATKEVTLLIKNRVKSYAGVRMQDDYSQDFTVEMEVRQIECDSIITIVYGEASSITLQVLPALAAAGKTLRVVSQAPLLLGVETDSVVLDDEGKAEIILMGNLPGTAALDFSVDGYDVRATSIVKIEKMEDVVVATPTASLASGSEVEAGTEVYLSCATENAVIYYTLDGSCPCDPSEAVMIYDGTPIVINETTTIKAMACVEGMLESEVATFVYVVKEVDGIEEPTQEQYAVYPRLVKNVINIDIPDDMSANVCIASISGQTVYQQNNMSGRNAINMNGLQSGMYVVAIRDGKNLVSIKIIKLK